jgi:hypothetical protein
LISIKVAIQRPWKMSPFKEAAMVRFQIARTGLVFGTLLGGLHALWAGIVASGWGQWLLDLIFWLHFIDPPYHVAAFELGTAAQLVGLTFMIGGLSGLAFALVWNALARPRA